MTTEPTESLSAAFDLICSEAAQKPAFTEQSGYVVTFERFYYTVHSLAHALVRRNFRPGQTICISTADHVFGTALLLAAMRRGLRVHCVLPDMILAGAIPPTIDQVITTDKRLSGRDKCVLLDASWLEPAPGPVENVGVGGVITGTSGTTGEAKFQFCSERVLMVKQRLAMDYYHPVPGPVVQAFHPGTTAGLWCTLHALLTGRHQFHLSQGINFVLKAMEQTDFGEARVPPFVLREFALAAQKSSGRHRIHNIYAGGSELVENLARLAREVFGARVYSSYSSSEIGTIASIERTGNERPGAVGRIKKYLEWRFVDPETGELSPTNSGELCLRVPDEHQKSSYLGQSGPYDSEGWVHTGDIGFIDENGVLLINGRVHQFLNIGGEKAVPSRYERMLLGFGGVADVAAFTIPDELGVDRLQLAVIPAEGFDESAFAAKCADSPLAKLPVDVFAVDSLPYSEAGKLDRRKLTSIAKPNPPIYSR